VRNSEEMAEPPKGKRGSINFCHRKSCRETDPPTVGKGGRKKRKVKRIRIGDDGVEGRVGVRGQVAEKGKQMG
jgi:hypothetical protein